MKAIIYCRKSTDEKDKQQQSLGTQLEWCEYYAEQNNIEVIDAIVVSESAKERGRVGFEKMMKYIEKKEANTIISMYIDRISRNPYDSGWVQGGLQEGKIKKIITSTRVYTIEDSGLLFSVESGFANEYLLKIKKGVRDGFKTKISKGGYYSQAPLGYLNDKINKTIIVDSERNIFIPKMFELRVDGYSCEAIRDILHKEGLRSKKTGRKVAKATIEACLKNPFYYGWIIYNGKMFNKGELYKGNHTPLITKKLFDKANKMERGVLYVQDRDLTPLKGKVYHYETKTLMTPSLIKKKYVYFQTRIGKNQLWCNQNEIIKYFDKTIYLYKIPKENIGEIKELLKEEYNKEYGEQFKQIGILRKQKTEKELQKQNLILLRGKNEITGEEFVGIKNNLTEEIEELKTKILEISQKNDLLLSDFNNLVELLFFGIDKWKTLPPHKKLAFINEVVVELFFDNKKRLYIEEKPLFKALKSDNYLVWSGGRGLNSHTQGLKP